MVRHALQEEFEESAVSGLGINVSGLDWSVVLRDIMGISARSSAVAA